MRRETLKPLSEKQIRELGIEKIKAQVFARDAFPFFRANWATIQKVFPEQYQDVFHVAVQSKLDVARVILENSSEDSANGMIYQPINYRFFNKFLEGQPATNPIVSKLSEAKSIKGESEDPALQKRLADFRLADFQNILEKAKKEDKPKILAGCFAEAIKAKQIKAGKLILASCENEAERQKIVREFFREAVRDNQIEYCKTLLILRPELLSEHFKQAVKANEAKICETLLKLFPDDAARQEMIRDNNDALVKEAAKAGNFEVLNVLVSQFKDIETRQQIVVGLPQMDFLTKIANRFKIPIPVEGKKQEVTSEVFLALEIMFFIDDLAKGRDLSSLLTRQLVIASRISVFELIVGEYDNGTEFTSLRQIIARKVAPSSQDSDDRKVQEKESNEYRDAIIKFVEEGIINVIAARKKDKDAQPGEVEDKREEALEVVKKPVKSEEQSRVIVSQPEKEKNAKPGEGQKEERKRAPVAQLSELHKEMLRQQETVIQQQNQQALQQQEQQALQDLKEDGNHGKEGEGGNRVEDAGNTLEDPDSPKSLGSPKSAAASPQGSNLVAKGKGTVVVKPR